MQKKIHNNNRSERIASTVQRHIAEILRDNYADDPVLMGVSVVGAESHGGLSFVRIYYYVRSNVPPSCPPTACVPRPRGPGRGAVTQSVTGGAPPPSPNPPHEISDFAGAPGGGDTLLHPSSPDGLRRDSGRGELDRFQKRLDAARPAIRRELAARMNQKYVPDIGFTYDDTLEKSARIDALLANIEKE